MTKDKHPDWAENVAAIDFDGVVKNQVPWAGCETINGEPVDLKRMISELEAIRKVGWKTVIWSARCSAEMIKSWLVSYGCDHLFDAINHNPWAPENLQSVRKIPATVYLDDRNVPFDGSWFGMAEKINNFKPWHEPNEKGE